MIRTPALAFALAMAVLPCTDALAQTALADDVVGLKIGRNFGESSVPAGKMDDVAHTETVAQWIRQNHGLPTRQLLRASDGKPCDRKRFEPPTPAV